MQHRNGTEVLRIIVVFSTLASALALTLWLPYSIVYEAAAGNSDVHTHIRLNRFYGDIPGLIGIALATSFFTFRARSISRHILIPVTCYGIYVFPMSYLASSLTIILRTWYSLAIAVLVLGVPLYLFIRWLMRRTQFPVLSLYERGTLFR
ncbi:hypothetical protein L2D14_01445 [Thalassospiraceae bacterium LMO-JJ14]|nr:hypothetical protein L2D14_01445 [Thalassospiraceae bacterium LMO-JJ14]